jgi:hypothetical protein
MSVRYILVTIEDIQNPVPRVLEDYIYSLNIFSDVIHVDQLTPERIFNTTDIFILTQMWIDVNLLPRHFIQSGRLIYLNVEMLTEIHRMTNAIDVVKAGFKMVDYSHSNLLYLNKYIKCRQLAVDNTNARYLPYQYNLRDQVQLANVDGVYTYDVGIINAVIKKDSSVNSDLTYRRVKLWEELQMSELKCINILGWGAERDELLKRCKVIINVHHFECFNIFEQIRCDRLIFAKKIIISDKSVFTETYDMVENVLWEDYDNIIPRAKEVVNNFEKYNNMMKSLSLDEVIENRRKQLSDALTNI